MGPPRAGGERRSAKFSRYEPQAHVLPWLMSGEGRWNLLSSRIWGSFGWRATYRSWRGFSLARGFSRGSAALPPDGCRGVGGVVRSSSSVFFCDFATFLLRHLTAVLVSSCLRPHRYHSLLFRTLGPGTAFWNVPNTFSCRSGTLSDAHVRSYQAAFTRWSAEEADSSDDAARSFST